MTKPSKSNFGKYFRYKLAQNKPVIFIYALLNFFTVVMPQLMIYIFFYKYANNIGSTFYLGGASESALKLMRYSIALSTAVITVMTIKSLRIYHDRAAMDTLGCLPLSYGERFWGDLLSGMCANFISFVPLYGISLFFKKPVEPLLQSVLDENMNSSYANEILISEADKMRMFSMLALIVLISYIGVYAVTTLISSCCGRFGTSVIFSFVAMLVIPGVYWSYANYFFLNAVGADPYWEICTRVGMIPPFGWVISMIMRRNDPYISDAERGSFDYLVNRPACFIVPILIIAAVLLFAYLIGKKRKAEKTGEGFVFKSVFYVLVMTLLMLVVGLTTFLDLFGYNKFMNAVVILPLAFLFYSALEVSENKSFKGFWKTVIRFVSVAGACFAFLLLINATNSFGYYKILPSEGSIKEVRLSGRYFFSETGVTIDVSYHTYKSDESVSAILNEHKKLLENEDGLITGQKLIIDYVTESGKEIRRAYDVDRNSPNGDSSIKELSSAVNRLQEFDPSVLGIIGGSDFGDHIAEYTPGDRDSGMIIRSDKVPELAEILGRDIKNYYFDDLAAGNNTAGILRFRGSGESYLILDVYEDTLAFLNDPANYSTIDDNTPIEYFIITYRTYGTEGMLSDMSVTVFTSDMSRYAKELIGYIEPTHRIDHTPPCFMVYDDQDDGGYKISPENEKAALKAVLGLLTEKKA